jgi:hypothetical protein
LFDVLLVIAPPSQELEPPANPARFIKALVHYALDQKSCFGKKLTSEVNAKRLRLRGELEHLN